MIYFRRLVMKRAYRIYQNSDLTWRQSLQKAWMLYRLTCEIKKRPVKFYYKKKDGSFRCALAFYREIKNKMPVIRENFTTFCYWDIDRRQWRCFRVENFIYFTSKPP